MAQPDDVHEELAHVRELLRSTDRDSQEFRALLAFQTKLINALREVQNEMNDNLSGMHRVIGAQAETLGGMVLATNSLQGRMLKVEHGLVDVRHGLAGLGYKVTGMDVRLTSVETRLAGVDERLAGVDERLAGVDSNLVALNNQVRGLGSQMTGLAEGIDEIRRRLAS